MLTYQILQSQELILKVMVGGKSIAKVDVARQQKGISLKILPCETEIAINVQVFFSL